MSDIVKKIYDYSLAEIVGECFGRYSKYIIQERAIPDIRDGLKPVQRRILYAMYKEKNSYDKIFRKSAKTVGTVIGNYHPHGDTSVYEAMVRMSQKWKQREPYVIMHGNNGSIDGDPAAAMRYTEAKLSKISNELLKMLDKDTVEFSPNFDDTELEPTVLPAKYPNLLVNGSTGISAGYATNIPPHNLGEVIDATIKRIDKPDCNLTDILKIIKGPDFPTGGVIEGKNELKKAYEKGKGKVVVRAKIIIDEKKYQIIIEEIPYEVNKSVLVSKIDNIRIDKKIEGIKEVRDESDREGLRIVIDVKKEAKIDFVYKYLLKNTDLKVNYNFNMVAIDNKRPKQVGIIKILDSYITHIKKVTLRRTKFDLKHSEKRLHIILGLIKALGILDELIATIRKSKNKNDAKTNLIKEFEFTEVQAEAIVTLQLYRLTNTDVSLLKEEEASLKPLVKKLKEIIENEEKLKEVIKEEMLEVKKEYANPRRTVLENEIKEIEINEEMLVNKEDVIVTISKEGYIKRTSLRSYKASNNNEPGLKENDFVLGIYEINTLNNILIFTDLGNYVSIPIYKIPDIKWSDLGRHISNIVKISDKEKVIGAVPVYNFDEEIYITTFTKNGYVKRTIIKEYELVRYQRPSKAINLAKEDKVIKVSTNNFKNVFIVTSKGYGLFYDIEEISIVGVKAKGIKSINLKDDFVVGAEIFEDQEYLTIITDKGSLKRIKINEFDKTHRALRGVLVIREVKTNVSKVINIFVKDINKKIGVLTKNGIEYIKISQIPINDRYSTGSKMIKSDIEETFIKKEVVNNKIMIKKEEIIETLNFDEEINISTKEIDEKILTIDDFLDDIDF